MIAERGLSVVALDRRASEPHMPVGIITADCCNPHEYDDGIAVEELQSSSELYRVTVFAADMSKHYSNEEYLALGLEKTESVYFNTGTSLEVYKPMLPEQVIQKAHFTSGRPKSALGVQFIVGDGHPPSDTTVTFGKVSVESNLDYRQFYDNCRSEEAFKKYQRASSYILHYLRPRVSPEYEATEIVKSASQFKKGAYINQSYMVAANYLVGQLMQSEEHLAIYRVHDPYNSPLTEAMSPRLARYSSIPGRHFGLGLDTYCRVTSPLRRLEDFIMHGLLRARDSGRDIDKKDQRNVAAAVKRLNQRIIAREFEGRLSMRDEDLWEISGEYEESSSEVALTD